MLKKKNLKTKTNVKQYGLMILEVKVNETLSN